MKAIRNEEQPDGPVIFEVTTGSTDFFQVIVVWDRWSDLSADVRTQIVSEAYRQLDGQVTDGVNLDHISAIIPVTVSQALEMGFFHTMFNAACTGVLIITSRSGNS